MLFREIIERVLQHRTELARLGQGRLQTISVLRRRSRPLIAAMGDDDINLLVASRFELYMAHRAHAGIAAATINQEMSFTQTVLRWADREKLPVSLTTTPRMKVEATEERIPDMATVASVIDSMPPHHRDAARFMAATGVSPHELERIAPCDIAANELHIGKRAGFFVKVAARRRTIPLNAEAVAIATRVAEGREPTVPMFPRRAAIAKALRRARTRRDANITPKAMRSLFASMVALKQPEHVLQPLLGHAPGSPTTRRHYMRSNNDTLRAAVAGVSIP
jgi:integrase